MPVGLVCESSGHNFADCFIRQIIPNLQGDL